ncbi:MAG: hypothetical protein RL490_128 [Pseudomonadota bacterium]|jgi:hypothetical protein
MANSTALSAALTALAESLVPSGDGKPVIMPAHFYRELLKARDEAVTLEARASHRDRCINALIIDLRAEADRLESLMKLHAEKGSPDDPR